jgi:hypothetical protein
VTISFSCPSCEHRLKVKDELAGRKVKCPSCGGGVLVPADEKDEDEAAAARPGRQAREESDEEERPRKKKKKKKKGNKGLIIGLGIGAVALVAVVVVLVIVLNQPRSQSDKGKVAENPPPKKNPVQQPAPQPQPHPEQRVAGIANRGEDTAVMNDMKNIGIFYNQYLITNPRGPKSTKAFADEIRRDAPHIAQALDKQIYVLLPGVRRSANMIVAYDVPGNTALQHIVLMGDGSVQAMPQQELQQYLKEQGK